MEKAYNEAIHLLQELIRTPSFSREEDGTARLLADFQESHGVKTRRLLNNVWAFNRCYDPDKPTVLLNSHHDTVRPNDGYTRDPFAPTVESDKLYGLGSNDAGASVVALLAAFLHFYDRPDLPYNLCIALTAEEEITGTNGIAAVLPEIGPLDFALVGEPTQMQLAVAERGLMVLDCTVHGKSGHAARNEGENAIYKALPDLDWFRTYRFPKVSDLFGEVKMSVTVIRAGTQHNVVPVSCEFTVDVRVTDRYTNEEVLEIIREHVSCEVNPRSTHLRSSCIPVEHPIVQAGIGLGLGTFGSPTTSDQVRLDVPSVKIGVGDSARSHMADEYVRLSEIRSGIETYIQLLENLMSSKQAKTA